MANLAPFLVLVVVASVPHLSGSPTRTDSASAPSLYYAPRFARWGRSDGGHGAPWSSVGRRRLRPAASTSTVLKRWKQRPRGNPRERRAGAGSSYRWHRPHLDAYWRSRFSASPSSCVYYHYSTPYMKHYFRQVHRHPLRRPTVGRPIVGNQNFFRPGTYPQVRPVANASLLPEDSYSVPETVGKYNESVDVSVSTVAIGTTISTSTVELGTTVPVGTTEPVTSPTFDDAPLFPDDSYAVPETQGKYDGPVDVDGTTVSASTVELGTTAPVGTTEPVTSPTFDDAPLFPDDSYAVPETQGKYDGPVDVDGTSAPTAATDATTIGDPGTTTGFPEEDLIDLRKLLRSSPATAIAERPVEGRMHADGRSGGTSTTPDLLNPSSEDSTLLPATTPWSRAYPVVDLSEVGRLGEHEKDGELFDGEEGLVQEKPNPDLEYSEVSKPPGMPLVPYFEESATTMTGEPTGARTDATEGVTLSTTAGVVESETMNPGRTGRDETSSDFVVGTAGSGSTEYLGIFFRLTSMTAAGSGGSPAVSGGVGPALMLVPRDDGAVEVEDASRGRKRIDSPPSGDSGDVVSGGGDPLGTSLKPRTLEDPEKKRREDFG